MAIAVVSGALANKPFNGGAAWTRLSWALGLRQLGFDVYFVEQIASDRCVDAAGKPCAFEASANLAYFDDVLRAFGLAGSAALICDEGARLHGLTAAELAELAGAADLLVNISGHLTWAHLWPRFRRRIYIDLDPGFTQIWHAAGEAGARLAGHHYFFTVGENIGRPGCAIPTGGMPWRPIRQPVVLEHWPVCAAEPPGRFTTVAAWRGPYGAIRWNGATYGLKVHQFRKFIELPRRSRQTFEIALDIHPADEKDRRLLIDNGWQLANPRCVAGDPLAFRRYVQGSAAEFSVAQGVYVDTYSGWFSDRTVRYLASGKPALVQDTGFSRNLPVGAGLLAFTTLADAVAGAERIARDYERHSRAARALAEHWFDARRVLAHLVEQVGVDP